MKSILSVVLVLFAVHVHAAPELTNITDADFESITKEMSANFTHGSIMGASKMGTIFGFQFGIIAAQTATPNIDAIAKRNPGSELPSLYNAGLMGAIGIPMGLAFEVVIIPKLTAAGASLSANSFALKYNINEVIPVLPINLALRGFSSNASFGFAQVVSAINVDVNNKTNVSGIQLLLSPMIPMIEPYVGIGLLNGSNELSVTGSNPIFAPGFSTAQSASKTASSTQILAGVDVNLLLLKLGLEHSQSFGASRTGFKLSFGF
ncbi:MAG: DUF6588 family protein [Bdellovibrionota bacterium]